MVNWKAVGSATLDTTRLWYLDFADAVLDRSKSWPDVWNFMWDRTEDLEQEMLHEWRKAGVRHPVVALGVLSEVGGTLYYTSLFRWPRRVGSFSLAALLLPTLWAMGSVLVKRQTQFPHRLHAVHGLDVPKSHPLTG